MRQTNTESVHYVLPTMARYFFSLEDGRKLAEDEGEELANDDEGEELANDEAAREVGLEIARDLARNHRNPDDLRVVVRTGDGTVVGEVCLKDAPQL
jgi:hypothetical protein